MNRKYTFHSPVRAIKALCAMAILMVSAAGNASDMALQQSDLTYLGAFRLPSGTFGCSDATACSFGYTQGGMGYNPANNSLYIFGHVYNARLAEVNIPTLVNSRSLGSLNTATVRQNFIDVWKGTYGDLGPGGSFITNGGRPGDVLVNGSKIVLSQWAYYDGGYDAVLSHATANANWSNGLGFSGMKTVGQPSAEVVGQLAGYMTWIPKSWQASLGGPALTGLACIAITTRTSMGPSAWVFDPNKIGVTNPVPATQVVGYPANHWTLGDYEASNNYIGGADAITGIVWPEGSSTVLFFGRHGDTFCYGTGSGCGDPADSSKGVHGYPYHSRIWAYNANDLVAVKNGSKSPWDLKPVWVSNIEGQLNGLVSDKKDILGVAYDPSRQIIYLSAAYADDPRPVIHAFQVNLQPGTDSGPTAPPNPPADVQVQ